MGCGMGESYMSDVDRIVLRLSVDMGRVIFTRGQLNEVAQLPKGRLEAALNEAVAIGKLARRGELFIRPQRGGERQ